MGIDIRSYVERLEHTELGDGIWRWDGSPLFINEPGEYTEPWEPFPRWNRDRVLFAFLDGGGQLGFIPTVVPRRGLPADISEDTLDKLGCPSHTDLAGCAYECSASWGTSWFLASELAAHDWDTPVDTALLKMCLDEEDSRRHARTTGELLTDWRDRFTEIVALDADPSRVRIVFGFDN